MKNTDSFSDWSFVEPKVVEHSNGFKLRLTQGTWSNPMALDPTFPPGMAAYEGARFLRLGVEFASRTKSEKSGSPMRVTQSRARKKPGPNTLSLKRETEVS